MTSQRRNALDNVSDNSYQGSMTEKAFIWTAVQTKDAE